ncbi:MAG: phosphatidylserine decarboxylase [Pelagibacteraceae bacterium TMED216]|nr:MAG: phosphatidylserine decarboxylase [Pelagibacteraceae bacterium TMED216]|tara:strand:+ start:271 stop:918 length:648 start_codon:yes stop_codon:yes gene_type:complete
MINNIFPKIHNEGYKFLAISIIATLATLLFSNILTLIFLILTIWVYYFFRDPDRVSINDDNFFVSPADGLITQIIETKGPSELNLQDTSFTRISIFMNVFNCHVNRSPISGSVSKIFYKPGKFFNASLDKASEENERNYFKIVSKKGEEIIVVQIAGLIARRIITQVSVNENLSQGQRIGMIRFGSRVDLYLQNKKILAKVGQNITAGESLLAKE